MQKKVLTERKAMNARKHIKRRKTNLNDVSHENKVLLRSHRTEGMDVRLKRYDLKIIT